MALFVNFFFVEI